VCTPCKWRVNNAGKILLFYFAVVSFPTAQTVSDV